MEVLHVLCCILKAAASSAALKVEVIICAVFIYFF